MSDETSRLSLQMGIGVKPGKKVHPQEGEHDATETQDRHDGSPPPPPPCKGPPPGGGFPRSAGGKPFS